MNFAVMALIFLWGISSLNGEDLVTPEFIVPEIVFAALPKWAAYYLILVLASGPPLRLWLRLPFVRRRLRRIAVKVRRLRSEMKRQRSIDSGAPYSF